MENRKNKYGFTLLELLIVVIIVGVLTAVALPMYKHSALKSRFSKVMPVAKAVADAQEVYYLGKNMYALNQNELDVTSNTDTHIDLATEDQESQYNYVAASRSDVPGTRYIMYQAHSPRFASNIHCEADASNKDALWLCEKGLQGTEITPSGSVQGGNYKTFLLEGTQGSDSFTKTCPVGGETREVTCECGGNVTQTGTCNTQTGTWEYSGASCSQAPASKTYTCEKDNSQFTVSYRCNAAGTAYEPYQSEGSCEYTGNCNASNPGDCDGSVFDGSSTAGVYPDGSWSGGALCGGRKTDTCNEAIFEGYASCNAKPAFPTGAGQENVCNGGVFRGEESFCAAHSKYSDSCNQGVFTGAGSSCQGEGNNTCNQGIYTGVNAYCIARSSNSCMNSVFETGTFCYAAAANTCAFNTERNNYKTGSCCYSEDGYCPAGSPKCVFDNSHDWPYWDGEYWS